MEIRPERPGDAAAIAAVISAAFRDHPHSQQTEAAIVAALRAGGALTVSLLAVEGGAVVGHAAFSPVTIDGADCGWFGLGPVSVLPGRQRSGAGSALIRTGLERLRAENARGCVVLGDPRYYGRFGFRVVEGLVYPGVPVAAFQGLGFGEALPRGVVVYHAGFAAV
jgi:putative acetyltransferase